jgi:hypothetical protein
VRSAIAWQLGEDRGVVVLSVARAVEDRHGALGRSRALRLAGKLFATANAGLTKPLRHVMGTT